MYQEEYKRWLEADLEDADLSPELARIEGNDEEIKDRFAVALKFGTAGLRGVLGAGTNRMNIYVVRQATQGLANWVKTQGGTQTVAISYDSRLKSDVFAKTAAGVLAANGINVRIYDALMPVPALSFATRYYNCNAGVMVTASHNPAKYNGYKCYDYNGYQMTDEEAAETYEYIQKVDYFTGIKSMDFDEAVSKGLIEYMDQDVIEDFLDEVQKQCVYPQICKKADLSVIYTPLNGTGNKPVRQILKRIGVENIYIVPEQEMPNGNFPTCPYPNPEIRQAFELALKAANEIKPDILLATDPDCDRVGIAVPNKNGDYTLMSGNEVGAMLLNYLLSQRKANGTLPQNAVAVKSFVSTDLAQEIAKKYNCTFKNLLTGFKYIGELITKLEAEGRASDFIMGFEESYGYLAGTHARDKDAVVGSMLICEMAAYYKLQGKSLLDVMEDIYKEFGFYSNVVKSYEFDGEAGMKKMASIMDDLRQNPPAEFAGSPVVYIGDYKTSIAKNLENGTESKIDLPKSNVLAYKTAAGNGVIVRPSGTEPKIKAYITAIAGSEKAAKALADELIADADKFMA